MLKENKGRLKGMAMLASMGMTMVLTTLMGLAVGLWLDEKFDTAPWLMSVFLFFGVAAGFRNIHYVLKKYGIFDDVGEDVGEDMKDHTDDGRDGN